MPDLKERIQHSDIRFVRINYSDMSGISKGKVIPARYFADNYEKGFPMMPLIFGTTVMTDCADDCGYGRDMDFATGWFRPDPSTFSLVPWREKTAQVICDAFFWDGRPVMGAPRSVLKRVLGMLEGDMKIYVGTELEFFLFRRENDDLVPFTSNKDDYDILMTEEARDLYERVVSYLDHFDIQVSDIHHEFAPGQYEINFKHKEVKEACDAAFTFRNIIRETASILGHHATFMPVPHQGEAASGYHLHLSFYDVKGNNLFLTDDGELSDFCRFFIGGIMKHAKALCALQCPTINSYKRIVPKTFAPYYITWGVDHREALARVIVDGSGTRVENRLGSSDANPYLVVASTLAAGMDGVVNRIEAPEPLLGDPEDNPSLEHLPLTLEEALDHLKSDKVLEEYLGSEFLRAYLAVKRLELKLFRAHVTDWERQYYMKL